MISPSVDAYRRYINPHWVTALESLGQPQVFNRAAGSWLYDDKGEKWLDLISGYGTALFGHNHPRLINALSASLHAQIPAISPLGVPGVNAELARLLLERTGLVGYLSWIMTSGSEAIECAVKLALTHTGKNKLICSNGGFHGLSALSIGLNHNPFWREGIECVVPVQDAVAVSDLEMAKTLISTEQYAAIVIEPIQATGGGIFWSKKEAAELHRLCQKHATLLIVDEVQTGVGRCGKFTAMQTLGWEVSPDILILSKGLTGGILPISVMLSRADVFASFFGRPGCAKLHGSTYAGNSHAVAVAIDLLTMLDEQVKPELGLQEFTTFHTGLAQQFPGLIQKTQSFGALHFLQTISPEVCYDLFQLLYESRILVAPCMHAQDTFKMLTPLNFDVDAFDFYKKNLIQHLNLMS